MLPSHPHFAFLSVISLGTILASSTTLHADPSSPDSKENNPPQAAAIAPALRVPDGLEVKLWAATPLVNNPISLDVDDQGRIWVAEGVNYRGFRNRKKTELWREQGDRIIILEDRDHDGTADHSSVFVENDPDLVAPHGVTVVGNQVIVACSPHLIAYTRDAENNMVDKKILLTGFGGHNHDHSLHKAQVGPDGRLYFNVGNAGPHVVTDRDGWTLRSSSSYHDRSGENTPGMVSDDGRVYVAALMLSVKPDGSDLKVLGMGGRNPFGTCVDSFGNVWTNDNDDTYSCRTSWWMRYGNFGYSSRDGKRSWAADRRPGQNVRTAHWRQDDPGVIPSGHVYGNGSPTGITYYENGSLGKAYDGGLLLSCEAGQNVIWGYRRQPLGAGFKLEAFPFLSSTDKQDEFYVWKDVPEDLRKWFRPSDITIGTDGTIYLTDWFDGVVGGHQMVDAKGQGAIYRIVAKGTNPTPPNYPDGPEGAIARLRSPAENVRATGLASLLSNANSELPESLYQDQTASPFLRARGLWAAGLIDPDIARRALENPDPAFRIVALRILEQHGLNTLTDALDTLVHDDSPAVLRELCLAVRDLPYVARRPILHAATDHYLKSPSADRWLLTAIGIAAEKHQAKLFSELLEKSGRDPGAWSDRFADLAWELHPASAIPAFKARVLDPDLSRDARRQTLDALAFIPDRAAAEAVLSAVTDGPDDLKKYAAYWIRHRETHHWSGYQLGKKLPALEATPMEQANRLIRAFMSKDSSPKRRREIAHELLTFPAGAVALANRFRHPHMTKELEKEILPRLLANPNPEVTNALSRTRPEAVRAVRDQTETAYPISDVLKLNGDPARGRELYFGAGTCASCHAYDGKGSAFGPDLTAIREKFNQVDLIDAIIRPNAALLVGYEATQIERRGGPTVLGFVESDDDPLVLRDASGQRHVIPLADITSRQALENSIMPPMSAILNAQQVADIVAFLNQKPTK